MGVVTSPELDPDNHDLKQKALTSGIDHAELEQITISGGDHEPDHILLIVNIECAISERQVRRLETAIQISIVIYPRPNSRISRSKWV